MDTQALTRIKPAEAAEIIGVSETTLTRWRKIGEPLPFFKTSETGRPGGKVFYFEEHVRAYIEIDILPTAKAGGFIGHRINEDRDVTGGYIAAENDRLRRAAQQIGDVIARNAGLIE